ncbi:MAG: fused MFS/spermidine synthase [Chloroflexi bacterium]|nr:fused MFS/spermidine synthase [Chloroflexota bacterium]
MTIAAPAAVRSASVVRTGGLLWGLVALFFFSGACGLVYQVLWVRLLSLAFGITVFAVTVVLASFMAGLAIGSFFGGRFAERLRRPLVAYGIVEIGVGLDALTTPPAFHAMQQLYPAIAQALGDSEAALFPVRVGLAFILLAIPTTLMGATLPIVVKSSLARSGELADRIGLLYAANTFGAITGAALAGFWLIGDIGISRSIQIAAAVNAAVGLVAIGMQRLAGPDDGAQEQARAEDRQPAYSPTARRVTLLAYGLSGVCSFAYEVVWTRMLALVLDTSIYAFVTMLTMVLVGIAVGSAVLAPFVRRRWNWPLAFAALEVAIAAGALWAIWAIANLAEIREFLESSPSLRRFVASPTRVNFVVAALTILPSTLVIGATFPIAARIYTVGVSGSSERLGEIYAANVFGAIFGSMLGGFLLLPLFGTQTSLLILSVASLGVAAALALSAQRPSLPARGALVLLALIAFGGLWAVKPDLYGALFATRFPNSEVLWFREGLETTVSVVRDPQGVRTLYTNSRGQANDESALVNYHRRIAHMPLLVRPRASEILIVGLGGGHTAGSILQHEGTRVDVIELSDAVLGGVEQFARINYNVMENPNLSVTLGDGRNYLLTTQKRYGLITSDTIQPFDAGSTNLYSAGYYGLVLGALKQDGIMAQWVGPQDDYQYKMMIRTFLSVFPHVTMWLTSDLLIGSREPITLDLAETARRFESPRARAALQSAQFDNPQSAANAFVATRDELERYVGEGPILTDDRPVIEYFRSLPGRGQGEPPDIYAHFSRDPSKVLVRR